MREEIEKEEYNRIIIDSFCKQIIRNNCKCAHCELNHNGWCFFGVDCLTHNFCHYTNED